MPTYTVTAVADATRDWAYKNGTAMKSYRVTLRNDAGRELAGVEWAKMATEPPPKVGDTTPAEASVDQSGSYGPRLIVPKRGGGGGGPRGKSPEERRSIAMQASHNAAVEIVTAALQHGEVAEDVARRVEMVADSLFRRVMRAEAGS